MNVYEKKSNIYFVYILLLLSWKIYHVVYGNLVAKIETSLSSMRLVEIEHIPRNDQPKVFFLSFANSGPA